MPKDLARKEFLAALLIWRGSGHGVVAARPVCAAEAGKLRPIHGPLDLAQLHVLIEPSSLKVHLGP
jgi:hypothetical protein